MLYIAKWVKHLLYNIKNYFLARCTSGQFMGSLYSKHFNCKHVTDSAVEVLYEYMGITEKRHFSIR